MNISKGKPPEWNQWIDYAHPSFVSGSNGFSYMSIQSSGPRRVIQDPVRDLEMIYWEKIKTKAID